MYETASFEYLIKARLHREWVACFLLWIIVLDAQHFLHQASIIFHHYLFHHSALFANICNQSKALTLCRVGRLVVWKAQIWVEAEYTDALSSKTKAVQLLS